MPEHQGHRRPHPSGEDGWFERALTTFVHRVSGRTVALVSLAFYPGLGLVVPLLFGWSTLWLADANLVGVLFAALLSLGWLFAQLEAKDRRHLLEWTTDLRHLSAEEFEWFVGEILRREGWDVMETGQPDRADGNVDLRLSRGRERLIVQCKRWQSWPVGIDEIRAFGGTLLAEAESGTRGLFVTFSDFTDAARNEAKRTSIVLVDGPALHERAEKARRPEPCPVCGGPMLLDRSPHGWWFRCTADGCSGKRHLAGDTGRAVELLTTRPWVWEAPGADA